MPANISALLKLPPYAPEVNPAESIWKCLRANGLANAVFDCYDDIVKSRAKRGCSSQTTPRESHGHHQRMSTGQ